jgi:hypothetical protein
VIVGSKAGLLFQPGPFLGEPLRNHIFRGRYRTQSPTPNNRAQTKEAGPRVYTKCQTHVK